MSSSSSSDTASSVDTTTRFTGVVKWFNNKAGFGFVTVLDNDVSGDYSGKDVFSHHTSCNVTNKQYRYLVQGEYVDFTLCEVNDENHKWQAGSVKGINNGKLMCETRFESRENRAPRKHMDDEGHKSRPPRDDAPPHYRVRTRGPGPREGEEWMLVRRKPSRPQTNSSPNREVLRSRHARGPYRDGE